MPDFSIRAKVKYGEEWDWEETQTWMEETQEAWINDFKNVRQDYKIHEKEKFAELEEIIAVNLFGITDEIARRAYRGTCILRYFETGERALVTKVREKMEKIAGSQKVIEMQIIPIAARMDADLKRTKGEDDEKRLIEEKNKNTGRIFVFRIKDANGNPVWLDSNLREYKTWEDYLTGNTCPQCIYCYPKDGFLLKKTTDHWGGTNLVENEVEFGEPPSCNLLNRAKDTFDKVVVVVTPVIAIGSFWCPATWAWTATTLGVASQGLFWYSLATQGYKIYDQASHGEDYGASLMSFITSIGTMLVTKGLSKYLRGVALQNRALSTIESLVITGFLMGMKGSQVASWAWMSLSLACKPELYPMDIVSYAVACHNIYSCFVSPCTAEKLLTKVKNEIQAEHLKAVEKHKKEVTKEKANLTANEAKLAELRANGAGPETIPEMEGDIKAGKKMIQQIEKKILTSQSTFLDNKGNWMEDEGAREEYNRFREDEMTEERRGANTEIDQNGRIIRAVTYMDAEMVFKMVSITGSKIQFANGQKIDLLINSQLEIHPRAVDQMNRIATGRTENDLKKVMELTRDYTARTGNDFIGDREKVVDDYITNIKPWLKEYEMITRIEIDKVRDTISSQTVDATLRERFKNMTPGEAYRMRTVLLDTDKRTLDLAYRMARAHNNNNNEITTDTIAGWIEHVKLDRADQPPPVPDTLERRREYHQAIRDWEIAGLQQQNQITPEEAERIANDNFTRRENIEEARRSLKTGQVGHMKELIKANKMDETAFLSFAEWNDGYFRSMQDQAVFDTRMTQLTAEINRISQIAESESLTIPNAIVAYYHVRKHGEHSRRYFIDERGWDIPADQREQQYFIQEKYAIFKELNKKNTFISQDGSRTSTIYNDGKGYFGVTKCDYDAELGRQVGNPTVATHFPKGTARPKNKGAAAPNPKPPAQN